MRVTDSMMVNTLLRNMSGNAGRLNDLQAQMSSQTQINKLSDDPLGVIVSLRSRTSQSSLAMYQTNLNSAHTWMQAGETALMDLNKIITTAYEDVIDATTDIKNGADRRAIAQKVREFRDQLVQTANASITDKYIFGGYNNTTTPFVFNEAEGRLYYNGFPMDASVSNAMYAKEGVDISRGVADAIAAAGGTREDAVAAMKTAEDALRNMVRAAGKVSGSGHTVQEMISAMQQSRDNMAGSEYNSGSVKDNAVIAAMDAAIAQTTAIAAGENLDRTDVLGGIEALRKAMSQMTADASSVTGADASDVVAAIDAPGGSLEKYTDAIAQAHIDVANLAVEGAKKYEIEIGYGLSMDVCMNGVDVLGTGNNNMFKILNDLYDALMDQEVDADGNTVRESIADDITPFISKLQSSQKDVLALTAIYGGRTNRCEILTYRYEIDQVNYTERISKIEDVDPAEIIMHLKMAESVYNASLSAGARIIQPSLMDFLR